MAPSARDGVCCECPRLDLVPDDIIRLGAGDLVPAAALFVESRHLHLQKAARTVGESRAVQAASNGTVTTSVTQSLPNHAARIHAMSRYSRARRSPRPACTTTSVARAA